MTEISVLLEDLQKIATPTIADALDRIGEPHQVAYGLRCIGGPGLKMVGTAFTVKETARRASLEEFKIVHILRDVKKGNVLVIDVEGYTKASTFGGLASLAAKTKGISGVVIDGACRDADEIINMQYPVFARVAVPQTGRGRIATISSNVPVSCGEVTVYPGDVVVGDDSGIVVIPQDKLSQVVEKAKEIHALEERARRFIAAGEEMADVQVKVKSEL